MLILIFPHHTQSIFTEKQRIKKFVFYFSKINFITFIGRGNDTVYLIAPELEHPFSFDNHRSFIRYITILSPISLTFSAGRFSVIIFVSRKHVIVNSNSEVLFIAVQ